MIQEDSKRLIHLTDTLVTCIDEIGFSFDNTKPGIRNRTILELLYRFKSNLSGISANLNHWPREPYFQSPISILYRAVISDCLTTLYLLTFYEHEDSFINELFVLNRKFVQAVDKLINNLHYEMPTASFEEVEERRNFQRNRLYGNSDEQMFKPGTNDLKKPEDLRETSNKELFIKKENIKRELGDTDMFDQISMHPLTNNFSQLFNLYKYFSQHQHFSLAGSPISKFPPATELRQWVLATTHTWELLSVLARFFSIESAIQTLDKEGEILLQFESIR